LPQSKRRPAIQRWLVIPDLQTPYHDTRSLAAVEKLMKDYRFDGIVYLGDFLDFDAISSHNIGWLRLVEGKRLLDDYAVAAKILDRHQSIIRKKNKNARFVVLEGNHEYRLTRFIDANPSMEGMIEVPVALDFKRRGIQWVPFWSKGEVFRVGKAMFLHGRFVNDHHAKKTVQRYGYSCFYGHTHDVQTYSAEMYGTDTTLVGQSLGCLCLPQNYTMGAPTRWQQACAVFEFLPDGNFGYTVVRINRHRFVYGGKVYSG
jgi:predicted phosphodiesterase